jgi:hypothetical protein
MDKALTAADEKISASRLGKRQRLKKSALKHCKAVLRTDWESTGA